MERAEQLASARHQCWADEEDWNRSVAWHLGEILRDILINEENCLNVLDLGCGVGRLLLPIAKLLNGNGTAVGIDISWNMLDHAEKIFLENGIYNYNLEVSDGRHIPAYSKPKIKFSLIYSVSMFQHIPPDAVLSYIRQSKSLLTPDGVLRFQYVAGEETAPLLYQFNDLSVVQWCYKSGFKHVHMAQDPYQFNWRWVTCKNE